ncbi:MAG: pyridoxal-phosphate dependent enzyme [Balneolaceae bacterium]|jgi:threonine dehydratase
MISVSGIQKALDRIYPYVIKTPVEYSDKLSKEIGTQVYLKLENLQVSGSFKPRGGFNKIIKTREDYPNAEFVAPTAGGHGVGLSYAAKELGAKAHILMPEHADQDRLKDIRGNGASIQMFESVQEASCEAIRLEQEKGFVRVSAYNDTEMIEGGGTIALELIEQLNNIDCLVCGVGGGGYLAGMSIILKAINPDIKIYGVQQQRSPFLAQWFKNGKYPKRFASQLSIAEGIGGRIEEDSLTWPYIRDFVEDFLVVSENDIRETIIWTLKKHKYYTEPSGVVGLSAIRKKPELFQEFDRIATVLTGRNMSLEKFGRILK